MNFREITQYERKLYNNGIRYVAGVDEVGRGPLAGPFVAVAVILDLEKIFSKDLEDRWPKMNSNMEVTGRENVASKRNNEEMSKLLGNTKTGDKNNEENESRKYINNDVEYAKNRKYNQQKNGRVRRNEEGTEFYRKIDDSKKLSAGKREILSEFIRNEAISYSIETFEAEEVDRVGLSELTQRAFLQSIRDLKIRPQFVLTDMFRIDTIRKKYQKNIVNGDSKSISIASASIVAKVYRDEIMIKMHEKYPVYGFDRHKGYGTGYHIDALKKYGPCDIHRKSFKPVKELLV
jgi:ribonuclease HII